MAHICTIMAGVWMASVILLLGVHSSNLHNGCTSTKPNVKLSRSGRIMKQLSDSKAVKMTSHMRSSADQFLSVLTAPMPPHRAPIVFAKHTHTSVWPQLMRRIQNNVPPTGGPPPHRLPLLNLHRNSYESAKRWRYSPSKGLSPFEAPLSGKSGPYTQQFVGAHPNALPLEGSHQGPHQHHQQPNQKQFKASPHYNGNAILRPVADNLPHFPPEPEQSQHSPSFQYQPVLQYPIPQQKPQQCAQYQQQQQQKNYPTPGPDSAASYQSPHSIYPFRNMQFKQQSQKSQHFAEHAKRDHYSHLPQLAQHSYSIYENDSEVVERDQALHSYNKDDHDATAAEASSAQEAQKYLKFMGSNEYFLPKRDPNYKKFDGDQDQLHYQQQQRVQHQQQQIQYGKLLAAKPAFASTSKRTYSHGPSDSAPSGPYYKQPIKVSQLLYSEDAAPSATVVRGSYQAGKNVFVVNSDDIKAVKHVLPQAHGASGKVTPLPTFTNLRYRDRTPEPMRFEFTERDAVNTSYTNSPIGHLKYKVIGGLSAITATSTIATTTTSRIAGAGFSGAKQVVEPDNDPEDGEDMQEASSDVSGRIPVRVPVGPSTVTHTEQKDTEDYCELICANVQDDDEEIVCGSDGYMYTSEAQMECYASCLHIDVTIQSKGSCSTR